MAVTAHDDGQFGGQNADATFRTVERRPGPERKRNLLSRAPLFVEIVLALLIGLLALNAALAMFSPLPAPVTLPDRTAPVSSNNNALPAASPFRTAQIEAVAATDEVVDYEETSLKLKLHGVYTFNGIETAFISTPKGVQGNFRAGETIWNNVKLERVLSAEQVVISVAGARETLTLINRDPKEAARARRAEQAVIDSERMTPPSTSAAPGMPIGDIARLQGAPGENGIRLVVQPGSNLRAFQASGLKANDTIIAVNGRRIGPDAVETARRLSQTGGSVALTVERGGETLPVTLDLTGLREKDE